MARRPLVVIAVAIAVSAGFYLGMVQVCRIPIFPRFFILAVALIYLFAALLPFGLSRHIGVRVILLAALATAALDGKAVTAFIATNIVKNNAVVTVHQACAWLKRQEIKAVPGTIIVGARSDIYALELGEEVSRKFITMAEAQAQRGRIKTSRMLVYAYDDATMFYDDYFAPLAIPRRVRAQGMEFIPVYVTPNMLGVIYKIEPADEHG